MESILLISFLEAPENILLEQLFVRIAKENSVKIDIIHDYENINHYRFKIIKNNGFYYKYYDMKTLLRIINNKYYKLIFFIDLPKNKHTFIPYFYLLNKYNKCKYKIFYANHLLPTSNGSIPVYNLMLRKNYFNNFSFLYILEYDENIKILVQNLAPNSKIILRNFTVDTYYYSPQKIKNEGYILSAGNAHRDYNTLIKAIGMQYKFKIYTNHFPSIDILKNYPDVEWIELSKNIRDLKDAILKSKLVIIPIPDRVGNLACGNSIAFISMALGKIVLCPDNIYYRRYIQDGYNGFLYKRLYEKEIKNKIMEIMNISDVLIRKIEKNARKTIVEKASNYSIVKEIFDVFVK
jgi:glycosyltransferase involved in cell wall biosynthesis